MNFIEAVKAAKNGAKIRRAGWLDLDEYCYRKDNWIMWNKGGELSSSIFHFLAEDWEIVEEKKLLGRSDLERACNSVGFGLANQSAFNNLCQELGL